MGSFRVSIFAASFLLVFAGIAKAEFAIKFSGDVTSTLDGIDAGPKFRGSFVVHSPLDPTTFDHGTADFHYRSGNYSLLRTLNYQIDLNTPPTLPEFQELNIVFQDAATLKNIANFRLQGAPGDMLPSAFILMAAPDANWFQGNLRDLSIFDPAGPDAPTATIAGRVMQFSAVPEPASIFVFAAAMGSLALRLRKGRK